MEHAAGHNFWFDISDAHRKLAFSHVSQAYVNEATTSLQG